jgi:Spy/CpxP family protein refolding chaperone
LPWQEQGAVKEKEIDMKNLAMKMMAVLVVLLLIPASGFAAGEEWGKKGGSGKHFDRMATALELTEDQRSQIRTIWTSEREQIAPLRQQMRQNRRQIHQAALAVPFDEAAVRTLAAAQAEARTEMIVAHARVKNQVHAVLTPEQREKAEQLWHERKRGEGPRHGMKRGR